MFSLLFKSRIQRSQKQMERHITCLYFDNFWLNWQPRAASGNLNVTSKTHKRHNMSILWNFNFEADLVASKWAMLASGGSIRIEVEKEFRDPKHNQSKDITCLYFEIDILD